MLPLPPIAPELGASTGTLGELVQAAMNKTIAEIPIHERKNMRILSPYFWVSHWNRMRVG